MSGALSLAALAEAEVVALHAFFVAWFAGGEADFSACEGAFAADFRMVTPDGKTHERDEVLGLIRDARGGMTEGFDIRIGGLRAVWEGESAILLEYVEQQYRGGRTTQRRSTALFTRAPSAPRGVQWRHLQETWMEAAAGQDKEVR